MEMDTRSINHPKPFANETLSSWFRRLAATNGLTARELYRALMPGSQLFTYDLDRYACSSLIQSLAEIAKVPEEYIQSLMLQHWDGIISSDSSNLCKLVWRPPAGRDGSIRSFGQQICIECLREDVIPYYRSTWRLSFQTVCIGHQKLLLDRCPNCSEPIHILRSDLILQAHTHCWNCLAAFDSSADTIVPDTSSQARLNSVLRNGWGKAGSYGYVHSVIYFDVVNLVFRLLVSGRCASRLRQRLSSILDLPELAGTSIPRLKEAERLNTRCRHQVLNAVGRLLDSWPKDFVAACQGENVTAKDLVKGNRNYPFPYIDAVQTSLTKGLGTVSEDELMAAISYLTRAEVAPTRRNLERTLGKKFSAGAHLIAPGRKCEPYGTSRYWKLDGVNPETRTAAKQAAKDAGENIGAWVDNTLRRALTENAS